MFMSNINAKFTLKEVKSCFLKLSINLHLQNLKFVLFYILYYKYYSSKIKVKIERQKYANSTFKKKNVKKNNHFIKEYIRPGKDFTTPLNSRLNNVASTIFIGNLVS